VINRFLEAVCAALLAATVLIAFAAVIFRYVIGSSLSWSFEASLALLTYTTFLGSYLAMRKSAHLKVEVLVIRFPVSLQGIVFLINKLIVLGIAAVMIVYGVRQVLLFQHQTTLVMEMPVSVLYAAIPLSGALMGLQAIVEFGEGLSRWRRGEALYESEDSSSVAEF